MQTSIKKINSYTIELIIKESSVEFEKCKNKIVEEIKQNANIKGFRKGSDIPYNIIEKNYGLEYIEEKTINLLINNLYYKALKKENIIPTGPAKLKELKSKNPFEIILEIEVLPDFEIDEKKIKKIKIKKTKVSIEDNEVDEQIKQIEKKFTTYISKEDFNIVELNDKVTIDTLGFECKGGVELPETKVVGFPLIIGSNTFIPGFENNLIGAKIGEVVEFEITFPADYSSPNFKGKCVFFMTTIIKIEKPTKPEWNEDFIEKLRGIKTDFIGFKDIIKDEIKKEKEYQARLKDENELLEEFFKIVSIDIGDNLLNNEINRIFEEHKNNIEYNGMQIHHYLEHIKKDESSYKEEIIKPTALKKLKAELILEKLKKIIVIEITEDEITEEINKILKNYHNPEVLDKLKVRFSPGTDHYEDVKNRLNYKKIIDTFFE